MSSNPSKKNGVIEMTDSGDYNIDIDADEGIVTIVKPSGVAYDYTIEELQGKGIIDDLLSGGAKGTVYSQGEQFALEEYMQLFGEIDQEKIEDYAKIKGDLYCNIQAQKRTGVGR